jgi:hypothetical protein
MSLRTILEAAVLACTHGMPPMFCFLVLWGIAQTAPVGGPPSLGRFRLMLWAAGIFMLIGFLYPCAGFLVTFSSGNYIDYEFKSSLWLACSIGLSLLAARLLRRMSARALLIIGIDSLLLTMHLGSWLSRYR